MARLIDADELLKHKTDHEMISTHLIYNAPTVDAVPREKIDEMIAEISVCKTENEMRIAERDYKSRLWISGIFSEIVGIIHKYCDKENNNGTSSD